MARVIAGYRLDWREEAWVLTEVVHLLDRPMLPDTVQRQETVMAVEDDLGKAIAALTRHAALAGLIHTEGD